MTLTQEQIIDAIRRVAPSDGSVLITVVFCSGDVQDNESRNVPFVIPPHTPIEEIEREAILQTLARTSGNVKLSAQILHYPRPTFYRKLKKFGIKVERSTTTHGRPRRAAPTVVAHLAPSNKSA